MLAVPLTLPPTQRVRISPRARATLRLEVEQRALDLCQPRVVVEPADFVRALDADPVARTAYDHLSYSHKREHVLAIESAKKAETRIRLIEKTLAMLRDQEPARGHAPTKTQGDHP